MKPNTAYAIFSAEKAEYSAENNAERTEQVRSLLTANGSTFEQVQGCWQGKLEQSFAVVLPTGITDYLLDQICRTAYRYGQDSVLYVSSYPRQHAAIIDTSSSGRPDWKAVDWVGWWEQVSELTAKQECAYTADSNGNYYIIVDKEQ